MPADCRADRAGVRRFELAFTGRAAHNQGQFTFYILEKIRGKSAPNRVFFICTACIGHSVVTGHSRSFLFARGIG
jgi:hypothetical protein